MNANTLKKDYTLDKYCSNCNASAKIKTGICTKCGESLRIVRAISKNGETKPSKFAMSIDSYNEIINNDVSFNVTQNGTVELEQTEENRFDNEFESRFQSTKASSKEKREEETKEDDGFFLQQSESSLKTTSPLPKEELLTENEEEPNFEEMFGIGNKETSVEELPKEELPKDIAKEPCSEVSKEETPSSTHSEKEAPNEMETENLALKQEIKRMQEMFDRQTDILSALTREISTLKADARTSEVATKEETAPKEDAEAVILNTETTFGKIEEPKAEEIKEETPTVQITDEEVDEIRLSVRERVQIEYEEMQRKEQEEQQRIQFEKEINAKAQKTIEIETEEKETTEKELNRQNRKHSIIEEFSKKVNDDGYYNNTEFLEDDTYKKSMKKTITNAVLVFCVIIGVLYGFLYFF